MRKLREAAAVVAVLGTVTVVGAGVAAAHEEPPASVSITCEQDTGNNTLTTQEGGLVNAADALNGGDANSSANQQLCGLSNEDPENTAGDATGGAGGAIGGITVGAVAAP
ncbi:hypothetical protein HCC61_23755 [Streptomyces sp. HNM0575]|uniref:hypothetical protein n=1 Tax=Streptomyces sp. HNM0575 TaxID=2716338 RepID=UPI00145ED947|nr:hypothetical protein [Streptomyces sp. HNM0575]NLU75636.1 hypothetical protein [Streptomyces sp. HNM0575]